MRPTISSARRLGLAGVLGVALLATAAGPSRADTALLDTMPPPGNATTTTMLSSSITTYSLKATVPTESTTLRSITWAVNAAPPAGDFTYLRVTVRANNPVGFANDLPGQLNSCAYSAGSGTITCTGSITIPAGTTPWITWVGQMSATMSGKFSASTSPSTALSWVQGAATLSYCTATQCFTNSTAASPAVTILGYVGDPPVAAEPVELLQQVGMRAGATCATADVPTGTPGAGLGGWSQSWAEWAVPVTGGAVCTRVLRVLPTGLQVR